MSHLLLLNHLKYNANVSDDSGLIFQDKKNLFNYLKHQGNIIQVTVSSFFKVKNVNMFFFYKIT